MNVCLPERFVALWSLLKFTGLVRLIFGFLLFCFFFCGVQKRKIEEVLYPAEIVEQLKNKDVQIKALENENARMLAQLAEGRRLMAERQRLLAEMEKKFGNDFL